MPLPTLTEDFLRLAVAAVLGMALGLTRDVTNKPAGLRTMGLVSLGSAIVTLTAWRTFGPQDLDAASRVIQGAIQGVMTGVGFIGAGAVLHGRNDKRVRGLTTAALFWVAAGLGIACGMGMWTIALVGAPIALLLVVVLHPVERQIERRRQPKEVGNDGGQDKV